jgi:uncharacterized protein (TIGR02145 family)
MLKLKYSILFILSLSLLCCSEKPKNLKLTTTEIREKAFVVPYPELYANNESYVHQIIYIKGKVVQTFLSYGSNIGFSIETERNGLTGYFDEIYVDYNGSPILTKNDYIEMWGEVMGLITYKNVLGKEFTSPHLYSLHIKLFTKDQEANSFSTDKIGEQFWMVENLNVAHYRNGDPIPEVQNKFEWINLKTGAWCYYNNNIENGKKFGRLYNWYAVNDPRGLAPEGWHIPSDEEFRILEANVNYKNNSLIERGQVSSVNTNESGFSALLAGTRYYNGNFYDLENIAYFWSSTEYNTAFAYHRAVYGHHEENYPDTSVWIIDPKISGFSVRCLKDAQNNKIFEKNTNYELEDKIDERESALRNSDKEWMNKNLNVSTFKNGEIIPEANSNQEWYQAGQNSQPAWCYYDNDPENGKKYGKLYNWYAVNDARGLAPEGWHIPTSSEFKKLEAKVSGNGNSLKAIGQGYDNGAGTNTIGFTAMLAGYRLYDSHFYDLDSGTYFWCSTERNTHRAYYMSLFNSGSKIGLYDNSKGTGFSVRCVRD